MHNLLKHMDQRRNEESYSADFFTFLDEDGEQMAHLEGRTKHTFRMPLQSHDKGSGRQFNGFNGSVGRYGGGDKSSPRSFRI